MVDTGVGGIIAFSFFDRDSGTGDGGEFTGSLTATEQSAEAGIVGRDIFQPATRQDATG